MSEIISRLSTALADRYRLERRLGEGGMATVYLAEDLKHKRKVAVKVLRPELAAVLGAERFVQEITTTASLQHPHILPLFDSGEADGFLYYVMPYIEGETLREKLNRETQLGIDEALRITTDVAEALQAAHDKGVIHRDIKPENVLVHKGRAMVADFGIALAVSAAAGGRMTETGLSLGTPHYMSPEQATAEKDITARSDLYSLGSVLYEMLTGEPPHTGSSAQQIIMKIVTDTPRPVTELRRSVPPNVTAAVKRALEKLPADRFDKPTAFADALGDPHFTIASEPAQMLTPAGAGQRSRTLLVAVLALAGAAAWGWLRPDPSVPNRILKLTVSVPNGHVMGWGFRPQLAISPDGQTIAYFSNRKLYLRRLDSFDAEVRFEADGDSPTFSDDGQWLSFRYEGQTWKLLVSGGPATPIEGAVNAFSSLDWFGDSLLIAAEEGLLSLPAAGGTPKLVTTVAHDSGETLHSWPQRLPRGLLLFTVVGPSLGWDDSRVVLEDIETRARVVVAEQATYGRYVNSGHVLFVKENGAMYAQPFDLDRRSATGDAVPVLESLRLGDDLGSASFDVSANGTLIFVQSLVEESRILRWWDRSGRDLGPVGTAMSMDQPELSPRGDHVAVAIRRRDNDDVVIVDVANGSHTRITFDPGEDETPVWSPDGDHIAYTAYGGGRERRVYMKEVDSDEPSVVMYRNESHVHITSWSPDGQWLAMGMPHRENRNDLWLLRLGDSTQAVPFLATTANELDARFSPDGRWIAYVSDESEGEPQVFVSRWPAPTSRAQISRTGGTNPRWSRDGRSLFFWTDEGTHAALYAVAVAQSQQRFSAGTPEKLFEAPHMAAYYYDVSVDAQRFLLGLNNPEAVSYEIRVVENFFEELKAKGGN